MYKLLLFAALALLFAQCKPIVLKWYGITQPRLEDSNSLRKFLHKKKIKDEPIYVFKNVDSLHSFYNSKFSLPDIAFFNREGLFVEYRENPTSCNAAAKDFIADLKTKSLRPDSSLQIPQLLAQIEHNRQPINFAELPKTEFYIVMYWAKYLGKTNEKVLDWQREINKARAKGLSITAIYVSCDYQKHWEISKKDLPKFKY